MWVLTDCQSALRRLERWKPTSYEDGSLADAIHNFCNSHPAATVRISFCRGHSGVVPNELVDSFLGRLSTSIWSRNVVARLPYLQASPQCVKDAIARRLEQDEDRWLPALVARCASKSALTAQYLGASRDRIRYWTHTLRHNRAAQCVLLKIVSNSACFWRGAQLRCPKRNTLLTVQHILGECVLTAGDCADVMFTLNIPPPLTPEALSKNKPLLPTLITALTPTIRWILEAATETAKEAPAASNAPTTNGADRE